MMSIREAMEVLNIPPLSTMKDIKREYRKLSKSLHPDIEGDNVKMQRLNEAYKLLMNYMENYRFSFSDDEIEKQFPNEFYKNRFRF